MSHSPVTPVDEGHPLSRWIDIGVNLTNARFSHDIETVCLNAANAGVDTIIITGTSLEASEQAIELIENTHTLRQTKQEQEQEQEREKEHKGERHEHDVTSKPFPQLFSTVGIHPHEADSWGNESNQRLASLAMHPQVVAIGETGLDFNRNYSEPKNQERAFEQQLELAATLKRPLFLHQRDAHQRLQAILKSYRDQLTQVVIHCFTDTQKALFDYLDLDCHIGITGWICDERRGKPLQEIVTNIPLNRLMLETDAPYLLPRDLPVMPDNKRNEPQFLPHIGHTVAKLFNIPLDIFSAEIYTTTQQFFKLPIESNDQ